MTGVALISRNTSLPFLCRALLKGPHLAVCDGSFHAFPEIRHIFRIQHFSSRNPSISVTSSPKNASQVG